MTGKAEKHRRSSRRWRAEHKDEVSQYNAEYYEVHKAMLRAARRAWYEAHRAEILAAKKAKYELAKQAKLSELGE